MRSVLCCIKRGWRIYFSFPELCTNCNKIWQPSPNDKSGVKGNFFSSVFLFPERMEIVPFYSPFREYRPSKRRNSAANALLTAYLLFPPHLGLRNVTGSVKRCKKVYFEISKECRPNSVECRLSSSVYPKDFFVPPQSKHIYNLQQNGDMDENGKLTLRW